MPLVDFDGLIERLQKIPFDELRKRQSGYFEFVLSQKHLEHLYPILEDYFGPPFKPAGVSPSREAEDHARSYGGIRARQTLYFFKHEGLGNCAMIWPWNNDTHVTVKVAQGVIQEGKR